MADLKELEECLDVAMATAAAQGARIEVLQSVIWLLLERSGDEKINGVRFDKWFEAEYRKRLQDCLISIENKTPAVAAKLQTLLDESDHRTGHSPE